MIKGWFRSKHLLNEGDALFSGLKPFFGENHSVMVNEVQTTKEAITVREM